MSDEREDVSTRDDDYPTTVMEAVVITPVTTPAQSTSHRKRENQSLATKSTDLLLVQEAIVITPVTTPVQSTSRRKREKQNLATKSTDLLLVQLEAAVAETVCSGSKSSKSHGPCEEKRKLSNVRTSITSPPMTATFRTRLLTTKGADRRMQRKIEASRITAKYVHDDESESPSLFSETPDCTMSPQVQNEETGGLSHPPTSRQVLNQELGEANQYYGVATMQEPSNESFQYNEDDVDIDDSQEFSSLQVLYKTRTCWCPAFFISISVICIFMMTVVNTKKSKKLAIAITSSPTPSQTQTVIELDPSLLINILQESLQVYSSPTTFLHALSPQARAMKWLIEDMLTCGAGEYEGQDNACHYVLSLLLSENLLLLRQRFALIVFAMSCGVDNWSGVSSWTDTTTHTHECEWDGVDCVDGHVTSIDLVSVRLIGTVPVELPFLGKLTHLDLSFNKLDGTLPTSFFAMRSLHSVILMENNLAFSIKTAPFWRMTFLEHLHLRSNFISGELPTNMLAMTQLKTIGLGSTQVEGNMFDFIVAWHNAEEILFGGCSLLRGTIPSTWRNTNLRSLSLWGTILTGTIPTEMGFFTQLTSLILGAESPETIQRVSNTNQDDDIVYEKNEIQAWKKLEGTLPSELGNLESLTEFGMLSSNIRGTLPTTLGRLTNLEAFAIADNAMNGPIPSEYGKLTKLGIFFIRGNDELSGTVPEELSELSKLNVLAMLGANLVGTLPEALCSISRLHIFRSCHLYCKCCDRANCHTSL